MIFGQINISNELLILYLIPHCIFKKSMSFYILYGVIWLFMIVYGCFISVIIVYD